MWTEFWDMHSGGSLKTPFHYIYIEAPMEKAIVVFQNVFKISPLETACECCGRNFAIDGSPSMEEATKFHRKGRSVLQSLEDFEKSSDVKIIREKDLKPEDFEGEIWEVDD
jgi:hypothetical protein